jgi:hypothetical protein
VIVPKLYVHMYDICMYVVLTCADNGLVPTRDCAEAAPRGVKLEVVAVAREKLTCYMDVSVLTFTTYMCVYS